MRRWIALGVAAVGVAWTPYLYSEWQATRGAARQHAELDDDELQQPSAAKAESQLSAAEDHPQTPKPPAPLPQPVPVAPDPSLQRRGEAVATAAPNAARPAAMPTLTARIPDTVEAPRDQQPERSPDAPLTTHAIDTAKPPPQAAPANDPPANDTAHATAAEEAKERSNDKEAQEPSAQEPANTPASEAPAQPSTEPDNAPAAANEAPEP